MHTIIFTDFKKENFDKINSKYIYIESNILNEEKIDKFIELINDKFISFIDENQMELHSIVFNFQNKYLYQTLNYIAYLRLNIKNIFNNIPIPIIIISSRSEIEIIKMNEIGSIILTPNIFIFKTIDNDIINSLKDKCDYTLEKFDKNFNKFLSIPAPFQFLSHHSNENILAMREWKKALGFNENYDNDYDIYFQFILAKNLKIRKESINNIEFLKSYNAKILIIDDQINEGWLEIFQILFGKENKNIEYLGSNFEHKTQKEIIEVAIEKVNNFKPNFIITDLRLHKDDFSSDIEDITGYNIIKEIKEDINFGIHIFCMSVTSKAFNLKKLNAIGLNEFIPKRFSENYHPIKEIIEKFEEYDHLKKISEWVDDINCLKKMIENIDNKLNKLNKLNRLIYRIEIEDFKKTHNSYEFLFAGIESLLNFKNESDKRFRNAFFNFYTALEVLINFIINDKTLGKDENNKIYATHFNQKIFMYTINSKKNLIYDPKEKYIKVKSKDKMFNFFLFLNNNEIEIKELYNKIEILVDKRDSLFHSIEKKPDIDLVFEDIELLLTLILKKHNNCNEINNFNLFGSIQNITS